MSYILYASCAVFGNLFKLICCQYVLMTVKGIKILKTWKFFKTV